MYRINLYNIKNGAMANKIMSEYAAMVNSSCLIRCNIKSNILIISVIEYTD